MAPAPPFTVFIWSRPGSFSDTINDVRAWLDHHKMRPALFKADAHGFEITFNSEAEARFFEREFGDVTRPYGLPV